MSCQAADCVRGAFTDIGFDVDLSLLTCHRNAVMSIHDEIDLPDFIEHNGRQTDVLIKGAVDARPALGELVGCWEEGAVEFVISVQTARDLVYTNGLYASVDGSAHVQFLLDLIIGKQHGWLAGQRTPNSIHECFEARPLEIGACLFIKLLKL